MSCSRKTISIVYNDFVTNAVKEVYTSDDHWTIKQIVGCVTNVYQQLVNNLCPSLDNEILVLHCKGRETDDGEEASVNFL